MFFSTSPIKLLKKIRVATITLSVLGILLSGYSIYVHQRKESNKNYKAFCDISEEVSCSKVFTSRYGKGFGILGSLLGEDSPAVLANGFYGIAFYFFVIGLGELQSVITANIQKYSVLLTNFLSVYLGYILLFVLKDKCVVCFSVYAINFLIAVLCFLRVHYLLALKSKKKGSKSASNQNAKQTSSKKNQQNANKNHYHQNKNNNIQNAKSNQQQQSAEKNNQISKKKEKKGQKQNAEPVVNHQNVSSKKKPEQIKNAQNNIKNRQPQNQQQNQSKKNQQNSVNASNKQQSSNKNANANKHSKKKNN